jgi:hypothetical protein
MPIARAIRAAATSRTSAKIVLRFMGAFAS